MKPRVLSGMRPTGRLHLGHWFGALQNWVKLQDDHDCFFMVADWHAIMSEYKDTSKLVEYSIDNVIDWLACGIDPKKSTIFIQSAVPEHAELHLALSMIAPIAWLERCPTYKEQVRELKDKDVSNYAFLGYPVLQTADIVLYKANVVPVGDDQLAHLELVREIVRRFNHVFGKEIFPEPVARLTQVPRILGLDGRKMSKSYGNAINLSDDAAEVKNKVRTMFTDPARIKRSDPGHPDKCNVYTYHNLFSQKPRVAVINQECSSAKIGCVECKGELAERVFEWLKPIQERRRELAADPKKVLAIIEEGNEKARAVAKRTIKEVKEAIFK